jgi:hypothetical protein
LEAEEVEEAKEVESKARGMGTARGRRYRSIEPAMIWLP